MAKSKIIIEIANNEISLEVALSRLMIIASDIGDKKLLEWAKQELNGYTDENGLPPYRKLKSIGNIVYSGINGGFQVSRQPLPLNYFSQDGQKYIENSSRSLYESADILEKISKTDNQVSKDLTILAGDVYENTGIQCINISLIVSCTVVQKVLSEIRTKILEILIQLDKKFGCLDDLDITTNAKNLEEIRNITYQIIYEDHSTHIGSNNEITKSNFTNVEEQ